MTESAGQTLGLQNKLTYTFYFFQAYACPVSKSQCTVLNFLIEKLEFICLRLYEKPQFKNQKAEPMSRIYAPRACLHSP